VIIRQGAADARKEQSSSRGRNAVGSIALIKRFMQFDVEPGQRSCRRIVLNEYFDSEEGRLCQGEEEACNVCSPSSELQCAIAGTTDVATEQATREEAAGNCEPVAFTTRVMIPAGIEEVSIDQEEVQAFCESQHD
jgi:hypothetical protein